jgi:hypothetical protein
VFWNLRRLRFPLEQVATSLSSSRMVHPLFVYEDAIADPGGQAGIERALLTAELLPQSTL